MTHFYDLKEKKCTKCGYYGYDHRYQCDNCDKVVTSNNKGKYDPPELSFDVSTWDYIETDNKAEQKRLGKEYDQSFDVCSPDCFIEKIGKVSLPDDIEVTITCTWLDLRSILTSKPKLIQPDIMPGYDYNPKTRTYAKNK